MIFVLLAFLSSFALTVVLMPIIMKIMRKKQASQTILGYVENHKDKNGTLTMGGVVFILTTLVLSFFFLDFDLTWFVVLLVSVFFGVLGFMDDFIKIKFKQNMGLRAYQKVIGQAGISIIIPSSSSEEIWTTLWVWKDLLNSRKSLTSIPKHSAQVN